MAKLTRTEQWVKSFRDSVKEATDGQFKVLDCRGKIRLQYRPFKGLTDSVMLPYEWRKDQAFVATKRIEEIFVNFTKAKGDKTLSKAAQVVQASSNKNVLDKDEILDEFRKEVPNASDKTWKKSYIPVLTKALSLLDRSKGKTIDGRKLMDVSLEQWEQGTRMRSIQRRSLKKFLEWSVLGGKLPSAYAPPATFPEIRKEKQIGYAFSDSQILSIIENEQDEKWRFAYQLLAVYGLRPEELRYLRIIDGINEKELHCIYRKSKGGLKGDKTKPRKLHPLFVKDIDGKPIDWKLQQRLEIGEELPSLGSEGKGGEAIRTHIKREYKTRKNVYLEIRKEAEKIGQVAKPYSFRHRYAKESHAQGIQIASIAEAMGHTQEVHLENYARFAPDSTTEIYNKANLVA